MMRVSQGNSLDVGHANVLSLFRSFHLPRYRDTPRHNAFFTRWNMDYNVSFGIGRLEVQVRPGAVLHPDLSIGRLQPLHALLHLRARLPTAINAVRTIPPCMHACPFPLPGHGRAPRGPWASRPPSCTAYGLHRWVRDTACRFLILGVGVDVRSDAL